MPILDALAAIYTIQESLSITYGGRTIKIKKAHHYVPRESDALSDVPCFVNTWTLKAENRSSSLRETVYDVRMQLAVEDANRDKAADIATAFMDEIQTAFGHNVSLGGAGSTSTTSFVGGQPTLVGFVWDNKWYAGLDLHLELTIKEVFTFSAGS